MTKVIQLKQGEVCLVDDEDYERLVQYNWWCHHGYAVAYYDGLTRLMHRVIIGAGMGQICDHINRNKLDNRRSNLRLVTSAINSVNRKLRDDNTSGYRGVYYKQGLRKWQAQIRVNGRVIYLGIYKRTIDAARAYDAAAKQYYPGEAILNFPDES